MDIQLSSNFERLLFDVYDRDPYAVRGLMSSLDQSRSFTIGAQPLERIRSRFSAGRADEQETAATIRTLKREADYLADPHTAVAAAVAEKEPRDPATPMVILSTAHPAKFPDAVEAACGVRPGLPDWLAGLNEKRERQTRLPADQAAVEKFISGFSRAAKGAAA
jgi:threonine synthase